MQALLEVAEGSIGLLEKAAQEADALEAHNRQLQQRIQELEGRNAALQKAASQQPALSQAALLKVAKVLEEEALLVEGMTAEKLASALAADPNQLVDLTLQIIRPADPQGAPTKAANTTLPGNQKLILFEGREVIDHDGWVNVLR